MPVIAASIHPRTQSLSLSLSTGQCSHWLVSHFLTHSPSPEIYDTGVPLSPLVLVPGHNCPLCCACQVLKVQGEVVVGVSGMGATPSVRQVAENAFNEHICCHLTVAKQYIITLLPTYLHNG